MTRHIHKHVPSHHVQHQRISVEVAISETPAALAWIHPSSPNYPQPVDAGVHGSRMMLWERHMRMRCACCSLHTPWGSASLWCRHAMSQRSFPRGERLLRLGTDLGRRGGERRSISRELRSWSCDSRRRHRGIGDALRDLERRRSGRERSLDRSRPSSRPRYRRCPAGCSYLRPERCSPPGPASDA